MGKGTGWRVRVEGVERGLGVHAHAAVLAAELEAILALEADGVQRLVHQAAVADRHHVAAQAGVDRGAVVLVAEVATVVVGVAAPVVLDALAVGALELVGLAHAVGLVRLILAVVVAVALPAAVDAARLVGALELVRAARGGAVLLVPAVLAIVVAVAQPRLLHADEVV